MYKVSDVHNVVKIPQKCTVCAMVVPTKKEKKMHLVL